MYSQFLSTDPTVSGQLSFSPGNTDQEQQDEAGSSTIARFSQSKRSVKGIDPQYSTSKLSKEFQALNEAQENLDKEIIELNKILSESGIEDHDYPDKAELLSRGKSRSSLGIDISSHEQIENNEIGEDSANPEQSRLNPQFINSNTSIESIKNKATRALSNLNPEAVDGLRTQLRNLPILPEMTVSETAEKLKLLAQAGLVILDEFIINEDGKITCVEKSKFFSQLAWEFPLFAFAYVTAVINLTVFIADSWKDGASEEAIIKSLTALAASLSSGTMYLSGTAILADRVDAWNASRKEKNILFSRASLEAMRIFFSEFKDPDILMKRTIFALITGLSVLLDAKNSALGFTKLTGSYIAGTFVGILNGLSEGLLPCTQLQTTWNDIFDPLQGIWRGSMHTTTQLYDKAGRFIAVAYKQSSENLFQTQQRGHVIPDIFTIENMRKRIETMSPIEREQYKNDCKAFLNDANKLTSEVSRILNKQPLASTDSRKHAGYVFSFQAVAVAITGIFVSAVMTVPEKFGHYEEQLKSCQELITTAFNSTVTPDGLNKNVSKLLQDMNLLNITTHGAELNITGLKEQLVDVCHTLEFDVSEFSALQNALNIASYSAIALALYQPLKNSLFALGKTLAMVPNMFRGKMPSVKEAVSNLTAICSTIAYGTIIYGIKDAVKYVTTVEETYGHNTSLFPPGGYALGIGIGAVIATLYGGAQAGTEALMTRAERRYLERRNIEHVQDTSIPLLTMKNPSKTLGEPASVPHDDIFEEPIMNPNRLV